MIKFLESNLVKTSLKAENTNRFVKNALLLKKNGPFTVKINFCRIHDHPVHVLSKAVPLAYPLRSKGPAFLKRPLIYDRSIEKASFRRS